MGRRNKNDGSNLKPGICKGATLREENSGKKEADVGSILKIKYLQKLAAWASGEAGIPPLGALFGHRLAANAEASGVPVDDSSFFCQRCESILQPGYDCTIRNEKCKNKKPKRSKETLIPSQNNIIYNCNFCHYHNSDQRHRQRLDKKPNIFNKIKKIRTCFRIEAAVFSRRISSRRKCSVG